MADAPGNARAKTGKRRQTTNRHGYFGDWTEPKLLTIYVVDAQGKRVNTAELPVTNDGTFGEVEPFMQLLEMHLVRLGINQAKQVLLLADGAEWIWLRIPPLLKRARLVRLSLLWNYWIFSMRGRSLAEFCRICFYRTNGSTGMV